MIFGPKSSAGNSLRMSAPNSSARTASCGVITPGIYGTAYRLQRRAQSSLKDGPTIYCAPARIHTRAVSASSTVPAPSNTSAPNASLNSRIISSACGTVIVISIAVIPPSRTASTILSPCALFSARITATAPASISACISSYFFIISSLLCKILPKILHSLFLREG